MRVVEETAEPVWALSIYRLSQEIGLLERCNIQAIEADHIELTAPTEAQIIQYMASYDSKVIVSHNDSYLEAYLIVKKDSNKYGGGQGRWVGMRPGIEPEVQTDIYRKMLEVAAHEYGWVWGRVSNKRLREFLESTIPEGALMESDSEIITYKRP